MLPQLQTVVLQQLDCFVKQQPLLLQPRSSVRVFRVTAHVLQNGSTPSNIHKPALPLAAHHRTQSAC